MRIFLGFQPRKHSVFSTWIEPWEQATEVWRRLLLCWRDRGLWTSLCRDSQMTANTVTEADLKINKKTRMSSWLSNHRHRDIFLKLILNNLSPQSKCSPIAIWMSLTMAFRCSFSALISSSWRFSSSCSLKSSTSGTVLSILPWGGTQSNWVKNCSRSSNEFSRATSAWNSSPGSKSLLVWRSWESDGEELMLKLWPPKLLSTDLIGFLWVSVKSITFKQMCTFYSRSHLCLRTK